MRVIYEICNLFVLADTHGKKKKVLDFIEIYFLTNSRAIFDILLPGENLIARDKLLLRTTSVRSRCSEVYASRIDPEKC